MINLRKIILQRNINNNILHDISFRKISQYHQSEHPDNNCYVCNQNKDTEKPINTVFIHNKCLQFFEKCNDHKCGILYSKIYSFLNVKPTLNEKLIQNQTDQIFLKKMSFEYHPTCYLCNQIYCDYHLHKTKHNTFICSWCKEHFKYYFTFILKNTPLYKYEDILQHIYLFLN